MGKYKRNTAEDTFERKEFELEKFLQGVIFIKINKIKLYRQRGPLRIQFGRMRGGIGFEMFVNR